MADAIDTEAKRRGTTRDALIAYYIKQHQMTGQNGTQAPVQAQPRPAPQAAPHPQYKGGILNYLLNSLGGNPNG